jgi:hypothetical protein
MSRTRTAEVLDVVRDDEMGQHARVHNGLVEDDPVPRGDRIAGHGPTDNDDRLRAGSDAAISGRSREQLAEQELRADKRDRIAADREQLVGERERAADERDRRADQREQLADERERLADERERRPYVAQGGWSGDPLQRSHEALGRMREMLDRYGEQVDRVEGELDREVAGWEREQAEVDREVARSQRENGRG